MNNDYGPIINLKEESKAFDLLMEFNRKIKIYSTEEEMVKTISKFLELGNPIGIVYHNELIAYYNLYCNNTETLDAYFGNLYVLEEYRRRGIAKRLVLSAVEFVQKRNYKRILLHVADDNLPAIKLYESLGFCYTGKKKMLGTEECFEMCYELGE
jgi:ribosomal protein S18 acetylase RimI-like enzyme